MLKAYLYEKTLGAFGKNAKGMKLICGGKKRRFKAKQWSECLHKGYSEFKVHIQEGVAGKESKDS